MGHFEWDEPKNKSNLRKHGIDFETATRAFDDPCGVTFLERILDGEERWHLIALVPNTMLLLVVSLTYPAKGDENLVRIISARRASKHEEEIYDEENA